MCIIFPWIAKIVLPPFRKKSHWTKTLVTQKQSILTSTNVQNLLCFLDKSTFIKATKNIFVKKEKSGQKVISGIVKYISVDPKEPFTDIYLTGF